ncbi:MAG: MarR family winged helix-turn-helix transcriptional regulator [Pyrinomonadaceae bacterium]
MDFEETVSYLLAKVSISFRNTLQRHMEQIGLNSGQVFLLFELWKADGQRQVDLAARQGLSTPTINKMVKGLVDAGLVTRERLEDDARSTRIFLTERGRGKESVVEDQWRELEEEIVSGLTEAERLMFSAILVKMRRYFSGSDAEDDE